LPFKETPFLSRKAHSPTVHSLSTGAKPISLSSKPFPGPGMSIEAPDSLPSRTEKAFTAGRALGLKKKGFFSSSPALWPR